LKKTEKSLSHVRKSTNKHEATRNQTYKAKILRPQEGHEDKDSLRKTMLQTTKTKKNTANKLEPIRFVGGSKLIKELQRTVFLLPMRTLLQQQAALQSSSKRICSMKAFLAMALKTKCRFQSRLFKD
jgi:hypothetical protein